MTEYFALGAALAAPFALVIMAARRSHRKES